MLNFQLSPTVYDFLKKLVQVILPAIGTAYFGLAEIWGLPAADKVTGTIVVTTTFLGIVIGISKSNYVNSGDAYSGEVLVYQDPERGVTAKVDMEQAGDALMNKDEIRLKVARSFFPEPVPPPE